MGTFAVPEEWTDKNGFSGDSPHNNNLPILEFKRLLDIRQLIEKIAKGGKKKG
jgi:hypothetical protein